MINVPDRVFLHVDKELTADEDFAKVKPNHISWHLCRQELKDILYVKSTRSHFVYLIVDTHKHEVIKCFKKEKNAERYIGTSERYVIQKICVD